MCNLYRGPPINASCVDEVHLATWFQRRRFFLRNRAIRNKNLPVATMFFKESRLNSKLTIFIEDIPRLLTTKFWSIWPSSFKEDVLEIRNKWRPCLLMDRDNMCNLYRGPSINGYYQVEFHLATWFPRRRFLENKNCLWRTCLLTDQVEMRNLYRRPSKDNS